MPKTAAETETFTVILSNSAGELDRTEIQADEEGLTLDMLADQIDHWPLRDGDTIRIVGREG